MSGLARFGLITLFCTALRFSLGEHTISFLWFFVLYFPFINWSVYWTMLAIRTGINCLARYEKVTLPKLRAFYTWYLNVPGACAFAEVVYQGYLYNR
ncbi:hypothetical protein [Aneurinibacillus uraniidurans]|uniref:hypothetical protein n=1 Tax=Aneurinibacillus uraniidurans TaxID=2966586 RepID=UPI00234B788F|nr:hypothetical protein [Aneurinibacillus sp. B1]WCN38259.1 hypothetical protein PO771_02255 [Aneurinibacillus sp. B1]